MGRYAEMIRDCDVACEFEMAVLRSGWVLGVEFDLESAMQ
jgi:hypothetical protein